MAVTVRPLDASERSLLERATLENLNWNAPRYTLDDVRIRPDFAHYTRLQPDRGDFGLVAVVESEVVGVVWAMYLLAHDPGFGFVDAKTPELSIWVRPDHRNRGIGRRLLRCISSEARHRGIAAISLSVEEGNPARHLYVSEGFIDQPAPGVMLRRAGDGSDTPA
ncbi:MAG TPA: GNAT family N-acetyltransferase [Acidimicrobiia bacterium]|nr:GNAT family N-acetyltransferase [Acidimicrobiia bacterium]